MAGQAALHLPRHQLVLVHATGWLLLATGVAWLGLHYLVGAGAGQLPHPLEAWMIRLHALAAWVAAFTLGGIAANHVPRGWHSTLRRRTPVQRRLGVVLGVLALALLASGYALMYWISEPTHEAWGWAHSAVGVAMAAVLVVHGRGTFDRRPA
ncbi:MAG TPA: hypothetical protein VFZ28_15555 [Burkholderiaceae bacterium]|nr:hypothetical protein [Burkholderiaceae bacterium]